MGFRTDIPAALAGRGLRVEVVPGWESRGSSSFAPGGVVCHWTAGPRGTTGRPSLGVVTNGRPGIPGPLCNVYLARDGVAVVVAAGRANHAGTGGYRGLSGNSSVYGIEAESAGDGDWTDEQRWAYPRVVAGLLDTIGRNATWACGHNEWAPTRKVDIRDYDMPALRAQVAAVMAGATTDAPEEDDVAVLEEVQEVRRMLGVLLGYNTPANATENAAMDKLYASGEARRMLGVLWGWNTPQGPEVGARTALFAGNPPATVDIDESALAAQIAASIPATVAKQVADELHSRLAS